MTSVPMPDEFFDTLVHHLPPEPPVGIRSLMTPMTL